MVAVDRVRFLEALKRINLFTEDLFKGIVLLPSTFALQNLKTIIRNVGSRSRIVGKPLPVDDPKVRQPDITVARTVLGWEPKVALREGLERSLPYFRAEVLG